MIRDMLRYLTRRKVRVDFGSLAANRPVSPVFGVERGTPVDRYYIENFLGERRELIRGKTLEVGESRYSRKFGAGRVESLAVLHATGANRAATIVGDLTDPATLPEGTFDCFICTQTLNFIFDVQEAVRGTHHLLSPGGVLLATVAGISQISRYDMERWGDYWRFTTASLRKLFEPVFPDGVEIDSFGNVLAAIAFLQGVALEELPSTALLDHKDPDYPLILTVVARKGS